MCQLWSDFLSIFCCSCPDQLRLSGGDPLTSIHKCITGGDTSQMIVTLPIRYIVPPALVNNRYKYWYFLVPLALYKQHIQPNLHTLDLIGIGTGSNATVGKVKTVSCRRFMSAMLDTSRITAGSTASISLIATCKACAMMYCSRTDKLHSILRTFQSQFLYFRSQSHLLYL